MNDLYAPTDILTDYINEYVNVTAVMVSMQDQRGVREVNWGVPNFDDLQNALKKSPIRSVEERYPSPESLAKKEGEKFPEKVARLNKLAKLASACKDIITYKRISNEVRRLLYGKHIKPNFPEPEFSPDLLQID